MCSCYKSGCLPCGLNSRQLVGLINKIHNIAKAFMNLNFIKCDFKKTLAPMWVSAISYQESTATANTAGCSAYNQDRRKVEKYWGILSVPPGLNRVTDLPKPREVT